ncbi:MAG: TIR domain-containing protein [Gammaproteobacteria bacterium]|nr:TIR domain-containing protein [Gammaproteobacteria bacterium]
MGHLFISYARVDGEFVARLHDALSAAGREIWVDWDGIPPTDNWMARIEAAIDAADAVLFVLSPDSLSSEVCAAELDLAVGHHKRLIPILHREPSGSMRAELAELNWIFMRPSDPFEVGISTLLEAVDTDLEWVQAHTRLLVRAVEWQRKGRESSLTLRGRDLAAFEEWLATGLSRTPAPTTLQSEFLLASRRAATRRQRSLFGAGAIALMVVAVLGTVAWLQSAERARQAEIVAARALLSRSEAARDIADEVPGARASHAQALRFAAQALARLIQAQAPLADADLALRKSYARLEKWRTVELPHARIKAVVFDPTGRFLLRYQDDGRIIRRPIEAGEDGTTFQRRPHPDESDMTLATDSGGNTVALALGTRGEDATLNALEIWDIESCERRIRTPLPRYAKIELDRSGRRLVTVAAGTARIIDLDSGEPRTLGTAPGSVRDAAPSPDGTAVALYTRVHGDTAVRVRIVDTTTGAELGGWPYAGRIRHIAWLPAGIFVHGDRGHLYTPEGEPISNAPVAGDRVALSDDGLQLAAASHKGAVGVISMPDGRSIAADHWRDGIVAIGFGPDAHSVAVAGDYYRFLARWHFMDRGVYALLTTAGTAEGLQFIDGRLEAWRAEHAAIWDLRSGSMPRKLADTLAMTDPARLPDSIAVPTPDAASDSGYDMAVAHARSGREAAIVAGEMTRAGPRRRLVIRKAGQEVVGQAHAPVLDPRLASFLAFAGNDHYLVIGTRDGLQVVDAQRLQPVSTLYHAQAIAVGLSADGRWAATGDERGRIKIWNVGEGTQAREIETPARVATLALSNDGDWVAGLGPDRQVRLWTLSPHKLIEQACRWLEAPCP